MVGLRPHEALASAVATIRVPSRMLRPMSAFSTEPGRNPSVKVRFPPFGDV